jgi:hypothetical protein
MPTPEVVAAVLYDGQPMVEILDDGTHRTVSAGVNQARLKGASIDVVNRIGPMLVELRQQVRCGTINPYRDAVLMMAADVLKSIPREDRGALRVKDVETVLTVLHKIAKRTEQ